MRSGIRESLDRNGLSLLRGSLAQAAADRVTGVLEVAGRPGGLLRFNAGLVVRADSPGAPGVETLLIRSGRVEEDPWRSADRPRREVLSEGHIGTAHLQVIRMMAMQDALFAIVLGWVERCVIRLDETVVPSPAAHGENAEQLLREAVRRVDALASLSHAVLPDRERFLAVQRPARMADDLAADRREILRLADGHHSARDIAFLAGRSVYAVTVEVSRMLGEGLLQVAYVAAPPAAPARESLPHRRPGASGINEYLDKQKPTTGWKDFLRFGGG